MQNRLEFNEWFDRPWGATRDEEGEQDGYTTFTSLGEFACIFPDFGGMMAVYPERGLMLHYDDYGDLSMATLSLTSYLFELAHGKNRKKLESMANGGKNIVRIADYLMSNQILVQATLDLEEGTFKSTMFEGDKETILADEIGMDFRRGLIGKLEFGEEFILNLEFMDFGDDLFMGVGETFKGSKTKYLGVEVSHHADYEEEILGQLMDDYDDEEGPDGTSLDSIGNIGWKNETPGSKGKELSPKRFEKLAKQILIAQSVIH